MSLQGPIVVVANRTAQSVLDALTAASAFPIVDAYPAEAALAISKIEPAAVILADPASESSPWTASTVAAALAAKGGPFVPLITIVDVLGTPSCPQALPIAVSDVPTRLIARLRAALRVRTLHTAVLRRIDALADPSVAPEIAPFDSSDDTTVLVAGRGRAYPSLTVAVGERMGLVGALSLESARSYLAARDIDALVIGDGFNRALVEDFVEEIGTDPRWRDLPVIVPGQVACNVDPERMPNLDMVSGEPDEIVSHVLPFARLHAFSTRLKRLAISLDQQGGTDADTGLATMATFMRSLKRSAADAEDRGVALSVARITLDTLSYRASLDAARIAGRLLRAGDFASRDEDGSLLFAFIDTDLASAHVVARRVASVLRHTALAPAGDHGAVDPTVVLAALRDGESAESLVARTNDDGFGRFQPEWARRG